MRSLRTRITVVTVIVATVAALLTGLISLQLVRSAATDEARAQLAAQAEILSRLPRLASVAQLREQASLALGGTEVALVRDGSAEGAAARYVDDALRARLAAGESISTLRRGDKVVMVEARPMADGDAVVLALPLASIEPAVGRASGRILLALGIGLVVAVVGGALLARLLARPLGQAAASARRLAAGERGVPVPAHSSTTEVAEVSEALSALDRALAASEGRQREFLLSISHDLRTPLTAIRGYGEALADGIVADPSRVGRTLVAEAQRLDAFVADLLQLARLEADDFTLAPEPIDVTGLLAEVAEAWTGRASTLDATIAVSGSGTVTADRQRLRQVIDGLVENALRVGASAVELRASDAAIEVVDNGPGLDQHDRGVAFERGALHARYRGSRPVGTGLGLSIAARLIERMGGRITAAGAAGGGTAFSVRLPPVS